MLSLICHPHSPSPAGVSLDARAAFTAEGDLALRYRLTGMTDALRLPAAAAPERVEGLWRHTCFEVFVMGDNAPAYREFNFSPSRAWQAYGFQSYRQGGPLARAVAPRIERQENGGFGLDVLLPASQLPPGARLWLGLSAVLESLGACRTLGSDSENRPRRGQFSTISPGNSRTIAQEMGENWAGAVGLQPEIPKSDRLLDGCLSYWALRHPPGRPDFHHSDCLALELVRP